MGCLFITEIGTFSSLTYPFEKFYNTLVSSINMADVVYRLVRKPVELEDRVQFSASALNLFMKKLNQKQKERRKNAKKCKRN